MGSGADAGGGGRKSGRRKRGEASVREEGGRSRWLGWRGGGPQGGGSWVLFGGKSG